MNKAPAFQFYAQDFLTGVMYLSNEEKGIYITMLAKQWTDGSIPKKRVGLLVGIEWDKFSDELKEKFIEKDGILINERLERERDKKNAFLLKQSENGKKGGRPLKKNKPNNNPTKSQKKPLEEEDEVEVEVEKEIEKRKGDARGKTEKLKIPFDSEVFKSQWKHWKIYKKKEFDFKYASIQSEQATLSKLSRISHGDENTAIEIIHQSMAEGWKGLFEIKNTNNGKRVDTKKGYTASESIKRKIAERLQPS